MKNDQETLDFCTTIVDSIAKVIGGHSAALHEPVFNGNEIEYIKECIDSTFVSSVGQFVDKFENDLADYTKSKYAISVVNGTSALHVALLLAGVEKNDEVLVPALTFVATANAVHYCGAIPHFVDSDLNSLGIDFDDLRDYLTDIANLRGNDLYNKISGRRIKAIVPMHTFGHPVDVEKLIELAEEFGLEIVEDAAESLGSTYKGKQTGTFGKLGVLSFNGNKIITTGGGGAILTDDKTLAAKAKHITTTAKMKHRWSYEHDMVGFNYRLPNLNAALGCAQLEMIEKKIDQKRLLFAKYHESISKIQGVRLFSEVTHCRSNYWLQTLILHERSSVLRDLLLESLNDAGYMSRPSWTLLNALEPFKNYPSMPLIKAKDLSCRIINIPSSSSLLDVQV